MASDSTVEGPDMPRELVDGTSSVVSLHDNAPLNRLHALFCVASHRHNVINGVQPPSPSITPLSSLQECISDVIAVFSDRRIVRCSGWWVHSDVFGKVLSFLPGSIRGVHVKTIPIVSEWCYGMAVNASETLMAVTCCAINDNGQKLYLYSLPGGELLRTIGGWGSASCQFRDPRRVCFGPDDIIIVADKGNSRLQAFSSSGAHKRCIALPGQFPTAVSVSHDKCMIGVGSTLEKSGVIVLVEYASSELIRVFGDGVIEGSVYSVCFTLDNVYVIVVTSNDCASMFAVGDGSFVRTLCHGLSAGGWNHDIDFADNGETIVCDYAEHEIRVYNSDGSEVLRSWAGYGDGNSEFESPTALSLVHGRLYVLDAYSPRVQVFE